MPRPVAAATDAADLERIAQSLKDRATPTTGGFDIPRCTTTDLQGMFYMTRTILLNSTLLCGALIASFGLSTAALATPFVMQDGQTLTSLGAEFSSPFDTFAVTGHSGEADGQQTVAELDFDVGPNCYICALTPYGSMLLTLTVGSVTEDVTLPWSWSSTGPTDTLDLGPIDPLTYSLSGGEIVSVSFETLQALSSAGGDATEALVAQFAVPEPSSTALLGIGLCGLGFIRRRRA